MAQRIKSVSKYTSGSWDAAVPIGADAENIDVKTSNSATSDLQTVLGVNSSTTPSSTSLQGQINNKVSTSGGNVASTKITSGISTYDTSASETSKAILSTETDGDDVVVTSGDSETLATMWSKFNRFRRRVSNKFADYFAISNLETAVASGLGDNKVYTAGAINDYISNVIGYSSTADLPESRDIASQLTTLNSNAIKKITRSGTTFTATKIDGTTTTFTQQDYSLIYDTFSKKNVSIGANDVATVTITGITFRSGYVRIYLVGSCNNSDTGGQNVSNCYIYGTLSVPSGTTSGTIHVRNLASTTAKVDVYVRILYISSSLSN